MRACCEGCALSRTWCRGHALSRTWCRGHAHFWLRLGCIRTIPGSWLEISHTGFFVAWEVRVTSTSVGWRFLGFMDVMRRHFGSSGRSRYGFSGPRRILHHTSVFSKSKNHEGKNERSSRRGQGERLDPLVS
jgi:hypothetical protein